MRLFVDTSALVKFYYPESDSEEIEATLLSAESIYVCDLAIVEFASALMRKVRMREISEQDKSLIWESFNADLESSGVEVVDLSGEDFIRAADLILQHARHHSLRTLDALQAAAALNLDGVAYFLTADQSLVKVAPELGLELAPV